MTRLSILFSTRSRCAVDDITSLEFVCAGYGAGPVDAVPGLGGRQTAVGVHAVRPGRRRSDLQGRDDTRRHGRLRADGKVRRTVAQGRHDRSRARGPRVSGRYPPRGEFDDIVLCFLSHTISTRADRFPACAGGAIESSRPSLGFVDRSRRIDRFG